MEAVVLCGLQAAGKTTFWRERLSDTHLRLSLELLRTRHREAVFLDACLRTQMRFVADGTNATAAERARYVRPALAAGFTAQAFWLDVPPQLALSRNAARAGRARVPEVGIFDTRKRLEPPGRAEGFSAVWRVTPDGAGGFAVAPA